MSAWTNDAVPNHNGNGFPHLNDPNAAGAMMDPSAFMSNSAQFNPGQFSNPQQQQQMAAMQNGPMRHASPTAYQNQNQSQSQTPNLVYQTNSVIPSKRPRPRDESITGSPRQNPGMQPPSRSETPQQQNYAGFQPGGSIPPQQNPGQFPHLQPNGSANASPSPIMSNQMRPGSVPQRVATASPHPFSPGAQQFGGGSQTSPVPSEHGTPQPNTYMQNMPPGYGAGFAPSPSNPRPSPNPNAMAGGQMMPQQMGQMPPHMYQQMQQMQQQQQQHSQPGQPQQQGQPQQHQQRPPNMTEQQKMAAYQMRLQQQLQGNMQMQAQMQAQGMGRGAMQKQQMPGMPNGQMPPGGMRPQPRPMTNINPEQFMKHLTALMNAKGLPLDPNPIVGDRPVHLVMLFQAVQSKGGYKAVTAANGWVHIAQALGLPAQAPTVPPTLKQVYERNLSKFEEVWMAQQKQRMMQQNASMAGQGTPQKQLQPGQQMNQGQMQPGQPPQAQQHTPAKPDQPPINGFSVPHPQQPQQSGAAPAHTRNSLSRGMDPSAVGEFSVQSPAHHRSTSLSMTQGDDRQSAPPSATGLEQAMTRMPQKSDEYNPCARELSTYGGIDLHAANLLGAELDKWNPSAPTVHDLGNIDIHALTRSLQSGIHGEVRLALDTLAMVAASPSPMHFMQLRYCDDLIDALVDCAEEQVDMLAEHTVEVSDEILLNPYEDVVRACRLERWAIKDMPVFGTTEYDLDRAVDRLICITTILRNFSFPGEQNDNHNFLSDESVIKMISVVIRYLGTRTMLLRTHNNTLDFMKDIVILLSNIAGSVELPGREQALCLLQFLLAFAPTPGPTVCDDTLFFPPYEPTLHPYTPHAVDALAKLLARDEPNRGFYKSLFAADVNGSAGYDLLTRTFALVVSPVPEKTKEQSRPAALPSLTESRKPFLMQGLLAAEILASLAPGSESGLARSWLASGHSLAQNLYRLVQELSVLYEKPQLAHRAPSRIAPRRDPELLYIVVVSVALLKRLIEKAGDPNSPVCAVPADLLPQTQLLMQALTMQSPEWTKEGMLLQLTSIFNNC
ncbi:ARID/BRIGHT DNA binding domain-containing protein [Hirsutella rhossiliensis]|uniref:ARID/BRIGHT DNA binding domain-containing protein n=1 Tax=Hirsutella rhossiliensis TaxID=111463 RepID=A0A9P8N1Y3_9HYPO|nr:ARID/BRIGHT DNA binding domain-containing protein [Hirsutella rhossiliensis]KAH0965432.1 ARID/BRIGHT DNA binding domain-containing protein [Hirsutella rhossiliensis]